MLAGLLGALLAFLAAAVELEAPVGAHTPSHNLHRHAKHLKKNASDHHRHTKHSQLSGSADRRHVKHVKHVKYVKQNNTKTNHKWVKKWHLNNKNFTKWHVNKNTSKHQRRIRAVLPGLGANRTMARITAALAKASQQSRSSLLEHSVAFFGAVDSRPHLFLQIVALQSVRRFHPGSGFFVLLPEARIASWRGLMNQWSDGHVNALPLAAASMRQHFVMPSPGYSAMTFHRHRVPQMLLKLGYQYSVNLDPDVLCSRPWDLRVLQRVALLGGRPVGSSARTAQWLQDERHSDSSSDGASASSVAVAGSSTRSLMLANGENVTQFLQRVLGLSRTRLAATREFNGGVLIFNNTEAARVEWGETMARYHALLRHVVEGDQDLIGLVLASKPTLKHYLLPTTYNYAYRRDRERLPYAVSHRLRHGLFEQQIVNVHFVVDGKPWQQQELEYYPLWLLSVRVHHLHDWLNVARAVRPRLESSAVAFTQAERNILGKAAFEALRPGATREANGTLAALVDEDAHRRCRCFMHSLAKDKKADPLHLLVGATQLPDNVAAAARALVTKQRSQLSMACGSNRRAAHRSDAERRQCNEELSARNAHFNCALKVAESGLAAHRSAAGASANCSNDIRAARARARFESIPDTGDQPI